MHYFIPTGHEFKINKTLQEHWFSNCKSMTSAQKAMNITSPIVKSMVSAQKTMFTPVALAIISTNIWTLGHLSNLHTDCLQHVQPTAWQHYETLMLENVNCKSEQKEKEKKTGRFAELAQQNKQGRKPRARAACDSLTKERPGSFNKARQARARASNVHVQAIWTAALPVHTTKLRSNEVATHLSPCQHCRQLCQSRTRMTACTPLGRVTPCIGRTIAHLVHYTCKLRHRNKHVQEIVCDPQRLNTGMRKKYFRSETTSPTRKVAQDIDGSARSDARDHELRRVYQWRKRITVR